MSLYFMLFLTNFNKEINVLSTILMDKENIYINADILSDTAFSKFNFDEKVLEYGIEAYVILLETLNNKY